MRATVNIPLFVAALVGGIALIAFIITVFFSMKLVAPFFNQVAVTPIGGVGKDVIVTGSGDAFSLLLVGGVLSVPGALILALLVGGGRRQAAEAAGPELSDVPRSGGPPF